MSSEVCDLSDSQVCAGGEKDLGACQGDSGSALVVGVSFCSMKYKFAFQDVLHISIVFHQVQTRVEGPWVLHGITSWSRGCALEGSYLFSPVFLLLIIY